MNALTLTNKNLVVFFCFSNESKFPVTAGWRFHCALKFAKKSEMKRSSALSTLQSGSFRKGALCFRFVASILLERINLKLLTTEQIFFHTILITFPTIGLMISSAEARVALVPMLFSSCLSI